MLTSTLDAYIRPWVSRLTCLFYYLLFQEWLDGWHIGKIIYFRVEFLDDKENNIARPF
jgi:hypothetical protein